MIRRLTGIFPALLLQLMHGAAAAQTFSATLSGNPVNTTGWTYASGASYVSGNTFILTNPVGSQSGYIYYSTPQNLTTCAEFTVRFEFQVTNSSSPPADGLAFWYISNPPTGFLLGSGIGLPDNPDGLLLVFDTYNNKGLYNNPLISLRGYAGTQNYDEGSSAGLLGSELTFQSWMTDGSWHSCVLTYRSGAISVFFDGNTTPALAAYYPLNQTGYFGFSASTGASWSRHTIRNVSIEGYQLPQPPGVVSPVVYCQDDPAAPLTATGSNLKWYTVPDGGTALPSAPVPNTSVPGTITWYVAQSGTAGCDGLRDSIQVIVRPKPGPPVISAVTEYCIHEPFVPFSSGGAQVKWYTTPTGGAGTTPAPVVNTDIGGVYTWYASRVDSGCESDARTPVTVTVYDDVRAAFDFVIRYGCAGDTVVLTNTSSGGRLYQWDFGDGRGSTDANPAHIFDTMGLYHVRLITRGDRCQDTADALLDLRHALRADFITDRDTVCLGEATTFTNHTAATSANGIDPGYAWDFGDGAADTAISPVHTYARAGVFRVRLVARNFVPCYDTVYRTVYVDTVAPVHIRVADSVLCEGQAILFSADFLRTGSTGTSWDFGDGTAALKDRSALPHAFDAHGDFLVTLTVSYRACPDASDSLPVVIRPYPVVSIGPDTAICPGSTPLQLHDAGQAEHPAAQWLWSTGETVPEIMVSSPGVYWLTATADGCSTTDSMEVRRNCYIGLPNIFTPNGDGVNDYFFPRTSLAQGVASFRMSVFNRWGQKVFETSRPDGRGWDGKYNGAEQPEGVYVYLIEVSFINGTGERYQGNVTMIR